MEVFTLAERNRAVGYVRVSTEEQAREGLSLAAQESRIRAYCEAKGWELAGVYRDEGYSGKDLNRPGIQSLIRDLKADGIDIVVVLKLDRLTRSVRDLGALIEDLFGGVALASVEESLDSSTANGRMVINLLGTVAQWEREVISERTAFALEYKRKQGQWAAGRIPFGFRIGKDGRLEEDPEQMKVIRAIKRARRRGRSLREIAKRYGLNVATVHKLVNTDLRTYKARYLAGVLL